jgi:hypothetical protein
MCFCKLLRSRKLLACLAPLKLQSFSSLEAYGAGRRWLAHLF